MAIDKNNGITGSEIDDNFPEFMDGPDGSSKAISSYNGAVGRKINAPNTIYVFPRANQQISYNDFDLFERFCRIDVLLIAGGGGGGSGGVNNVGKLFSGGGGGAGGLDIIQNIVIEPEIGVSINVGRGGDAGTNGNRGSSGENTSITYQGTQYRAIGGGGGGGRSQINGGDGGSGGGAAGVTGSLPGEDDNDFPNQGTNGGSGAVTDPSGGDTGNSEGGGGGGFGSRGNDAIIGSNNGEGGAGYNISDFMGNAWQDVGNEFPRNVAGGGGGGRTTNPEGRSAGNDGGGSGATPIRNAFNGVNRTGGGGGGGCGTLNAGNGGNGLVVIRYRLDFNRIGFVSNNGIPLNNNGVGYPLTIGGNTVRFAFHVFIVNNETQNFIIQSKV